MPETNELLNWDTFLSYKHPTEIKFAAINRNTDGDLVAAVTGKKIRVLSLTCTISGTNPTFKFTSGSGGDDISGAFLEGFSVSSYAGLFETDVGASLYVDLGGTSPDLQGMLTYIEI